jgi:hypothetical protein
MTKTMKEKKRSSGKPKFEIYKPYEMPKPKYRGPIDVEHMERLKAFSFRRAMADRPRSIVSELSPFATLAPPTRRGSAISDEVRKTEVTTRPSLDVVEEESRPTDRGEATDRPMLLLPNFSFLDLEPEPESEIRSDATSPTTTDTDDIWLSTLAFRIEDAAAQVNGDTHRSDVVTPKTLSLSLSFTPFAMDDLTNALNSIQLRS